MTKIYLLALTLILSLGFSFNVNSQVSLDKIPRVDKPEKIEIFWYKVGWFAEGNIGMRNFGRRSEGVERIPGLAMNGTIGYMFNSSWGVKGRADYYNHTVRPGFGDNPESKSHSVALSLLANADIIPMFNNGRKNQRFHFHVYGGAGLTTNWNPDWRAWRLETYGEFVDPFIPGADDMGHIIMGITPQYAISSKFAISLDYSAFLLLEQDRTYDYNTKIGGPGAITSLALGLLYFF